MHKIKLASLKYDIVIEENHDRNVYFYSKTGFPDMGMVGGYANNYNTTLINSKTNEKIEINYQDVYSMHDEKDNVSIEISSIPKEVVEKYAEQYGKSKRLLRVKSLLNKQYKDYKVSSIKNND